jgi:putative membrane protein
VRLLSDEPATQGLTEATPMVVAWRLDPMVLAGIVAVALLYGLYAGPLRHRLHRSAPVAASQVANFTLSLIVLWLALESPLDDLGDRYFFFAHMTQHLLLVLVVPVFALAGLPGWMLRPLLTHRLVAPAARLLTRPLVAFGLFNLVFALAHLPGVYDFMAVNEPAHAIEHLIFVGSGLLLWWPVLSPLPEYPRLSYPLQMGYLFLQTLPCSLVAALITLSGSPLYAGYPAPGLSLPISALQDQQIGGLIMWIGGTMYFFLGMAVVFFLWSSQEDEQMPNDTSGDRAALARLARTNGTAGYAARSLLDAPVARANHP